MTKVAIKEIDVSNRIRHDFGDLTDLQMDIKANGLLQPIVIDSAKRLLCGERRLRACKALGMEEIDAVVREPEDEHQALMMEIAENEHRKPFTFSERMAYAAKLEPIVAAAAKSNQGGSIESRKSSSPVNTRKTVAKEVGFGSHETYRKAKYVQEHDVDGQLVEELDSGEKTVDAAYRELKQKIAEQEKKIEEQQATIRSYEEAEDEQSEAYEKLALKFADVSQKLKAAEAMSDYHDRNTIVQNTIDDLTSERDEALRQRDDALDKLDKRVRPLAKDDAVDFYLAIGNVLADAKGELREKIASELETAYKVIAAMAA